MIKRPAIGLRARYAAVVGAKLSESLKNDSALNWGIWIFKS